MSTYTFTEQEIDILRNSILSILAETNEALHLVKSDNAKNAIMQEWQEYRNLLDKLCAE